MLKQSDIPAYLENAVYRLGHAVGLPLVIPPNAASIDDIARESHVRVRQVTLRGAWWREDIGALLALRGDTPVALLPVAPGRSRVYDPSQDREMEVDAAIAAEFQPTAYQFYAPLPARPLTGRDLLRFAFHDLRRDLATLLGVGVAGGLVGILTPVITGLLFDRVLPAGDRALLYALGGALVLGVLLAALFNFVCSVAVLRIEGRIDARLQPALWDRLLGLPAAFFRDYTAGDLVDRAMGVTYIKLVLTDTLTVALLSVIFTAANIVLLFVYDAPLALLAVLIVALSTVVTAVGARTQLTHQRDAARLHGETSGLTMQLLTAVTKLRVAGAEGRAFGLWERAFTRERDTIIAARTAHNRLNVFISIYPILASMALFAAVYQRTTMSTGAFLAFNAAFMQLLYSGLHLSGASVDMLAALPMVERLKPILSASPEVDETKTAPPALRGDIELWNVSFRYQPGGAKVLDGVSLHIRPGEFVALVGASGSGKSTLLRLLLGFEQPETGAIYYDWMPLAQLDVQAVRRQIGVVLQNSRVMAGTILSNITGAAALRVDDAWRAAAQAGLDDEIRRLPMGMQTVVDEEGSTFSGGQRQQLHIARALAAQPRILLLDEATSSLDDHAQAVVTDSLNALSITRVVVAHRLSTVIDADRILVLDAGRIVESGTYDELMRAGGHFAALAQRQMLH